MSLDRENIQPARSYLPDLLLFLSAAVWGFSFTVLKEILGSEISPVFFVFLRFFLASLILFPFCARRVMALGGDGLRGGMLLGMLLFIGFLTQTIGISFTTASKSAFITALSSVFVPVVMVLHKRKLPDLITIACLVLATVGLYMLTGVSGDLNIGDFLTLICALAFAAQIYTMGLVTIKHDSLALTFVQMTTTAILAGLLLPTQTLYLQFSLKALGALAFMVVFATAIALSVQTWAQKRTPAVRAGLIYAAEPVFAYMIASAILGESFGLLQKVGGAIIILAVIATEVIPLMLSRRSVAPTIKSQRPA